jgi:hypothetical protein
LLKPDDIAMSVGGKAGVEDFTELRWITVQTTPRHYPF